MYNKSKKYSQDPKQTMFYYFLDAVYVKDRHKQILPLHLASSASDN